MRTAGEKFGPTSYCAVGPGSPKSGRKNEGRIQISLQAWRGGLRPRVLLVDDEIEGRRLLRKLLESEAIAVVGEAGNGLEAMHLAMEMEPEVVLMDMRMPDMGGLEATRLMRESLPFTQVIILTAYNGPLPTRAAEEAGVYAYLVKGCSTELMRDVIEQAWHYNAGIKRRVLETTAALRPA
jgi:CheY-like chemotaxis protein